MQENEKLTGLTEKEAKERLLKYGRNELTPQKKTSLFRKILKTISEPMFLLLLTAAVIYFLLGEPRDGAIMLIFVVGIISIDTIQEYKTDKTLQALKALSAPRAPVIRDGEEKLIDSALLVPGDVMLVREGMKVPADGRLLRCSDLSADESSLTGESVGVWKNLENTDSDGHWRRDTIYAGTLITQGSGAAEVLSTGPNTEYGRIGTRVAEAPDRPTPLEKQTGKLVKLCAGIAAVLFALVGCFTYINLPDHLFKDRIIESILSGITLAMAMIPEEFPVILTVFLSMGAWRLAKKESLVRRLPAVETLGAVSVLCVDKTGTLTENRMRVEESWAPDGNRKELLRIMALGCEEDTYDPMEKAMLAAAEEAGIGKNESRLVLEYAFTNEQKRMGHVWEENNAVLLAAKGSPDSMLPACGDDGSAMAKVEELSRRGLRVIAVAKKRFASESDLPGELPTEGLEFVGLIGLADPPRKTVEKDIHSCTKAGIRVVMITGDGAGTASAIAARVGIPHAEKAITGQMLESMSDEELAQNVKDCSVFARVLPEHKLRIVQAFKRNGEIVAMTGDGVNDAPALKYADIGIAMGKRGSEVSREAADLILLDDNFHTIVQTIADGRRIFDNIRKAVGYVFTIHIPIALSSLIAPILHINSADLFLLPLHVVLLELLIDPTCSIVLERQPAETDIMTRPPRNPEAPLVDAPMLSKSLLQGLTLFLFSFGAYYWMLPQGAGIARSMGLAILMLGNILLVQGNASHIDSLWTSVKRLSHDWVMWVVSFGTPLLLALALCTPLHEMLRLEPLSGPQFLLALGLGMCATLWIEPIKWIRRVRAKKRNEEE